MAKFGFLSNLRANRSKAKAPSDRLVTAGGASGATLLQAMFYPGGGVETHGEHQDTTALDLCLSERPCDERLTTVFFDAEWYLAAYPDVAVSSEEPRYSMALRHYLTAGYREGRNPNALFDERWYCGRYQDNLKSSSQYQNGYHHFLIEGACAGFHPSPSFDELWYRRAHPDVEAAINAGIVCSGYHHFLQTGARAGLSPNPYFLPGWYCEWYPWIRDQLTAGRYSHAFEHYLREGAAAGLSPNPYFQESWYLRQYDDVARAVRDGSVASGHIHYLEMGHRENRQPSPVFDSAWYGAHYPEARDYVDRGLAEGLYDYFCRYGRLLGHSTSADFDEQWYLAQHPEATQGIRAGTWVDGLQYFVTRGILEGHRPTANSAPEHREQNLSVTACAKLELDDFLANNKKIALEMAHTPVVSVLLVLHNRAELTLRCLRSILNWADVPYEVIIVDNRSCDETIGMLARVSGVHLFRNQQNLHFLRAANQAASAARGEYLLFLNNDSEIQVGALRSAIEIFQKQIDVGAVGGKIILNNGVLQEAGSYVLPDGFSAQFGRGASPFASEFMHTRDVPYCSGAFLMTPRRLFLDSGGFDPAFLPAYYEDVDYCLRLWERGLRVVYNPNSVLLHHESASSPFRRFLLPGVLRNLAVFQRRYRSLLETLPDYGRAPIGSLDGCRLRDAYLVVVNRIKNSVDENMARLLETMLLRKMFVSIYPLEPWTGERNRLRGVIPDEVEVVGGRGIEELQKFLDARQNIYAGAICLADPAATSTMNARLRLGSINNRERGSGTTIRTARLILRSTLDRRSQSL